MPIRPENKPRYPPDWPAIRARILARAGNACEGSPRYPGCRVMNGSRHPATGARVVLTIAHLAPPIEDCRPENLRAWCQRCHLAHDRDLHRANAAETRRRKREQVQPTLLEVESGQ